MVLVLPVQSRVGAGRKPSLICRASSSWMSWSVSWQLLPPGAHLSGEMTTLPPRLPGRMAWLVPPVRPTVSYSCSQRQYELLVTSA